MHNIQLQLFIDIIRQETAVLDIDKSSSAAPQVLEYSLYILYHLVHNILQISSGQIPVPDSMCYTLYSKTLLILLCL